VVIHLVPTPQRSYLSAKLCTLGNKKDWFQRLRAEDHRTTGCS
jgi:hypothetical protein